MRCRPKAGAAVLRYLPIVTIALRARSIDAIFEHPYPQILGAYLTSESNRIAAASIAYVDGVCRAWGWAWHEIGQADDDGLDGLVYLRTMQVNANKPTDRRSWKHQFTGGLIHVQVKSGESYVSARTSEEIEVSIANLSAKKDLWMKSPLPVALIYVKDESVGKMPKSAWWADLKSPETYSQRNTIRVSLRNRFQAGIECRRPFERLASGQHRRLGLAEIDMSIQGQLPSKLDQMKNGAKVAAIDFYRRWKSSAVTNPVLGKVIVNRTGWSHMTRVDRPVSRILTSFELLPAAARIVSEVRSWQVLRRGASVRSFDDDSWAVYEYIGLSAIVKWPARAPSEVTVILRRQTTFAEESTLDPVQRSVRVKERKTWFYSVYEPGRRRQKN